MGGKALAQTPAGQCTGAKDSPFKTIDLDHTSYQVNNYRMTRYFYAGRMGMEVKNDNGKTQCELYLGNSMLLARNRFRSAAANARPDTGGGIPGYSSFHVSDPDGFNLQISGWAGPKDSVTKK
jgi:catechol 2,3-dioxygenase-like lactoylglutathione lyase family enzyme